MTRTRTFLAADVDDGLLDRAIELAERLRPMLRVRARWVGRASMHATVRFFGDVDDERLTALRDRVPDVVASASVTSIRLRASGLDAFPDARRARVLVLPLEDDGGLARLHAATEEAALALGFEEETRAFRPHLTLARLREPADVRGLAAEPLEGTVTSLSLYASRLGPDGPTYTPLVRIALAEPPVTVR